MSVTNLIAYIFLLAASLISCLTKKLTLPGAITGAIIGLLIYKGAGLTGLLLLATFFIIGTAATKWQAGKKITISPAEKNDSRRTAGQVLANGGVAAVLGLVAWHSPDKVGAAQLMIAGSLAAATADTLSSELGMIYGCRFFNILTFKKDECGLDGVVSMEGTLIGLVGAMLIAGVYSAMVGWSISFYLIAVAGLIGNLVDSVLGALLERRGLMGNNVVNFLNTLAGALVCWLLI